MRVEDRNLKVKTCRWRKLKGGGWRYGFNAERLRANFSGERGLGLCLDQSKGQRVASENYELRIVHVELIA